MREKMESEGSDTVRMGSRHHLKLQHRPGQAQGRSVPTHASPLRVCSFSSMHFSSGDATALAYLSYEDPFSPLYSV